MSIDCGAIVDGWHGDAAITVGGGGDLRRARRAGTGLRGSTVARAGCRPVAADGWVTCRRRSREVFGRPAATGSSRSTSATASGPRCTCHRTSRTSARPAGDYGSNRPGDRRRTDDHPRLPRDGRARRRVDRRHPRWRPCRARGAHGGAHRLGAVGADRPRRRTARLAASRSRSPATLTPVIMTVIMKAKGTHRPIRFMIIGHLSALGSQPGLGETPGRLRGVPRCAGPSGGADYDSCRTDRICALPTATGRRSPPGSATRTRKAGFDQRVPGSPGRALRCPDLRRARAAGPRHPRRPHPQDAGDRAADGAPSAAAGQKRSGGEKAIGVMWTIWACAVSVNLVVWVLVSAGQGDGGVLLAGLGGRPLGRGASRDQPDAPPVA